MREQLIQYVNLLFAGNPDAEDIKQEILQNTLDRYDDLVSQGKSPEAAYSLAISGIGDISEILNGNPIPSSSPATVPDAPVASEKAPKNAKLMRAIAIAMYICCVIPVIALGSVGDGTIGVAMMFILIAGATALLIMAGDKDEDEDEQRNESSKPQPPQQELKKAISSISGIVTLCVYLAVSFATGAWWITWLIFPISGAVSGLIKACIDLKEASKHEN